MGHRQPGRIRGVHLGYTRDVRAPFERPLPRWIRMLTRPTTNRTGVSLSRRRTYGLGLRRIAGWLKRDERVTNAPASAREALVFWVFHSCFWLSITALCIGMSRAVGPSLPIAWSNIAIRIASGFLITAAVYWVFRLSRLRRLTWSLRWPLFVATTVVLLVTSLDLMERMGLAFVMVWTGSSALGQVVPRVAAGVFWCTACLALELFEGLYVAEIRLARAEADAARRKAHAVQMEAEALEHEVHRLQAQMNPHFLFNALNAIVACKHDPDEVARVTQDLADFLRGAIRDTRLLEPLSREIALLERYLSVQQIRFGSKLDCRIVCDRPSRSVMAPPLMIQPLLENAIAYGMQTSPMPLRVEVMARVIDGWLEVVVANSGAWVAEDTARSPGTGIKTLRKRLARLIGPAADVEVSSQGGCRPFGSWAGVQVVVRMPVAPSPTPSHDEAMRPQESPA